MQCRIQLAAFGVVRVFVVAVLSSGLLITAKAKHIGGDNSIISGTSLFPRTDSDDSDIINLQERTVVTTGRPHSNNPTTNYLENDVFGSPLLEGPAKAQLRAVVTPKGQAETAKTGQTESVTKGQGLNEVPVIGEPEKEVISPTKDTTESNAIEIDALDFTQNPDETGTTEEPNDRTADVEGPEYGTSTTEESNYGANIVEGPEYETSTTEESNYGANTVEEDEYETGTTTEHKYKTGITEDPKSGTDFTNDPNSRSGVSQNKKINHDNSFGPDSQNKENTTPRNETVSRKRKENGAWVVAASVLGSAAIGVVVVTGSCFVYLIRKQNKKVYAEHMTMTIYQKANVESEVEVEVEPTAETAPQSLPSLASPEITLDIQSDVLEEQKCSSGTQKGGLEGQEGTLAEQGGSMRTEQGGLDKQQDKEGESDLKKSDFRTEQRQPVAIQDGVEISECGLQGKTILKTLHGKSEEPDDGDDVQKGGVMTKAMPRSLVRHVSFV